MDSVPRFHSCIISFSLKKSTCITKNIHHSQNPERIMINSIIYKKNYQSFGMMSTISKIN